MSKDTDDKSNKTIYAILGIIIAAVIIYAIYRITVSNRNLINNKPNTDLNKNENVNIYDGLDEIKNKTNKIMNIDYMKYLSDF